MKNEGIRFDKEAILEAANRIFSDHPRGIVIPWAQKARVSDQCIRNFLQGRKIKVDTVAKIVKPLGFEVVAEIRETEKSA